MKKIVKLPFHCLMDILMLKALENCKTLKGKNLSEKIDFLLVLHSLLQVPTN